MLRESFAKEIDFAEGAFTSSGQHIARLSSQEFLQPWIVPAQRRPAAINAGWCR